MSFVKKFLTVGIIVSFLFVLKTPSIYAQENMSEQFEEEILEADVIQVIKEQEIIPEYTDTKQLYQKLELIITRGSLKDEKIIIESGNIPLANLPKYETGDKVIVSYSKDLDGNAVFMITDFIRRDSLLWLFLIFIILTVTIAKWRGLLSLFGMGVSFLVIFLYILPQILKGSDPVFIAVIGSLIIIPVTFFFSHGLNKKTVIAIAGTLTALIITGILANVFVSAAKLTGFATEEAGFLQAARQGEVNIRGLLLAGIIIGVLGVLDDITISQSAIVFELNKANQKLKISELYNRAMRIGQDHISSMVNTLILVYTGAALPLLLLFIDNPHPFTEVVNYEIIADEIVRTLVGSIGLILAVPITTFLAAISVSEKYE